MFERMHLSGHRSPLQWLLRAVTLNQHYLDQMAEKWLTLRSQQVRIEAQEVCAEVEPALAGHLAFPVAA